MAETGAPFKIQPVQEIKLLERTLMVNATSIVVVVANSHIPAVRKPELFRSKKQDSVTTRLSPKSFANANISSVTTCTYDRTKQLFLKIKKSTL